MTAKPVRLSPAAARDLRAIARRTRAEAGEAVALDFADALGTAVRHIGHHASSGSLRYAHALYLPGLRVWPLRRFPHLLFYLERASIIDVWRVLHGRRDIPESLRGRSD